MGFSEAQGGVLGFRFKKIIDETSAPATTYIGYAEPGTSLSINKWSICRISILGATTTTEWANGSDSFVNIWNNRATLAYS